MLNLSFKSLTHDLLSALPAGFLGLAAWEKLQRYAELVNTVANERGFTTFHDESLWKEGIYESIISLLALGTFDWVNKSLLDIGAGAGFPSIPFAIIHGRISVTILEPMQKRAMFLAELGKQLDLNLTVVSMRAEVYQERTFDVITARAVADLFTLIMMSHHLLKIGGSAVFLKGSNATKEVNDASVLLSELKISPSIIPICNEVFKTDKTVVVFSKEIASPTNYPLPWKRILSLAAGIKNRK